MLFDEEEIAHFKKSGKPYNAAPDELKARFASEVTLAKDSLRHAIREGATFEQAKALSIELLIPLDLMKRPANQVPRKTSNAGPFEIWFKDLFSYCKIGIGDSLEEDEALRA